MFISAALSVGAAVMLVFKLVTPQAIAALGTPELVGLLMLLAMPMAGVWARRRGAAAHGAADRCEAAFVGASIAPKGVEDDRARLRQAA